MGDTTGDLKRRYEAFSNGDLDTELEPWADDFTWQGSNSTELPGGGEHRGKDNAIKVLQEAVGAWDEFKLSADAFKRLQILTDTHQSAQLLGIA